MEQGEADCDLLYITPVESLWAEIGAGWNSGLSVLYPELIRIEEIYTTVWNTLVHANIDFDFGDEDAKTGTPPPRQQIINNPLFISQTGDNSNVIPNYGTMNLTLGKHGGSSNE